MPQVRLHQADAGEPSKPAELGELPPLTPLLVDIRQLAVLLTRSETCLHRDDAAGRLPKALRIGGAKRWRLSDVQAWVAMGCPKRSEFEARQKAK